MTIDEAIKQEKEFALKCRKSVEIAICENKKYDSDNIGSLRIYETIQANKDTIEMYTRKAEYHEQLAEWLEKLNSYKLGECINDCEHYDNCSNYIYSKGYTKAIDDFVKKLEEHQQENWVDNLEYGITWNDIEQIAEQLKEGSADNE